jgi:8-amino-3,8-dideoxy-alpha-D-manno-octulosonate transaminase
MTSGEGGLVVCDDDALFDRLYAFHDLGYARNQEGRLDPNGDVKAYGFGVRLSEVSAAMVYTQAHKLDEITASMRARNQQLYTGLARIPGIKPRRVIDPAGDSGPFVIVTWPSAEICTAMVYTTRAAGVQPSPGGIGNIRMTDWGLHLYYNNVALVEKHGVNSAGRPWTDPLNAFSRDISYAKGALPVMDDLFERSTLIPVPPIMTAKTCDRIIDIFHEAAAKVGLT